MKHLLLAEPQLNEIESLQLKKLLSDPVMQKYLEYRKIQLMNIIAFQSRQDEANQSAEAFVEATMHYKGMLMEVAELKHLPNTIKGVAE